MITSTDEVNLQRLLTICESKIKNEDIDIWTGSEKQKFSSYINYLEFLQSRIQRQSNANSYQERIITLRQTFAQYNAQTDVEKGVKEIRMTKKLYLDQLNKLYKPEPEWLNHLKQHKDNNEDNNDNNNDDDNDNDWIKDKNEMNEDNNNHKKNQKLEQHTTNDFEGWDESEESILLNDLNTKNNNNKSKDTMNSNINERDQEVRKRNVPNVTREEETSNIEHVLQHHRQLHDEMTSDLGKMAQQLKTNTQLFGDILNKDDQMLKDAQKMVENNLDKMKSERQRLDAHQSKAWGTTCMNLGVVLFVCIMFILVFFTIKLAPKA